MTAIAYAMRRLQSGPKLWRDLRAGWEARGGTYPALMVALVRAKRRGLVASAQPKRWGRGPAVWWRIVPGETPPPRHSKGTRPAPEIAARNAVEARLRRMALPPIQPEKPAPRLAEPSPAPDKPRRFIVSGGGVVIWLND